MARMICSDADFVQARIASLSGVNTLEDVAERTGLKPTSVSVRMTKLRKGGVEIPSFPRKSSAQPLDVAGLNAMIANATQVDEVDEVDEDEMADMVDEALDTIDE